MSTLTSWPTTYSDASVTGSFRQAPQDFFVEEHLSFELTGEGEHGFFFIEKIGANTQWVAKSLAKQCGVKERDVSFAGLKDRHAVTRQWFSVYLPGKDNPETIDGNGEFTVLQATRHSKKLKRGAIKHNDFRLTLNIQQGEKDVIEKRLEDIRRRGVPNYFGDQRFGFEGGNIEKAIAMLSGKRRMKKSQQSILLSAIRSWFFNQHLAYRVKQDTWLTAQPNDRFSLSGTRSYFSPDESDSAEDIEKRLASGDISVAGCMPGKDCSSAYPDLLETLKEEWQPYAEWIESIPVKTDWRSMRVIPQQLSWQWIDERLELTFSLDSGSYATSVLSELGEFVDLSIRKD